MNASNGHSRFRHGPRKLSRCRPGASVVGAGSNAAKGRSNAAEWLPPNKAFRCEYVARQIAVKAAYGLSVTAPERAAMQRVLADCPDQGLPTG
jgi:hypothetical protein